MHSGPLIGMLVSARRKREWVLERYQPYLPQSLKLIAFAPADIDWEQNRVYGLHLEQGQPVEGEFPFPAVVYNRCYHGHRATIRRFIRELGPARLFNYCNQLDKWTVYQILHNSLLKGYLPDTFLLDEVRLDELLQQEHALFIKPCRGHLGKKVYRLERLPDGTLQIYRDLLHPRFSSPDPGLFLNTIFQLTEHRSFIVQKEIPLLLWNGQFFDIRLMLQKNGEGHWEVTAAVSRMAYPNMYSTSLCQHVRKAAEVLIEVWPRHPRKKMRELLGLGLYTAAMLDGHRLIGGLGEISVDFGLDRNGKLWIIEVNGKPQKEVIEELGDEQWTELVYRRPLEYAYFLARNGCRFP